MPDTSSATTTTTVTTTTSTIMSATAPKTNSENKTTNNGQSSTSTIKPRKIKTTWVNYLNKSQLESYLRECGMDDVGTVDELRRRLATYITGGHYPPEVAGRLSELEARHAQGAPTLCIPAPSSHLGSLLDRSAADCSPSPTQFVSAVDEREMLVHRNQQFQPVEFQIPDVEDRTFDRVRTWGLRFNDQMDPIDFVERVEESARSQRVPLDQVPFTLSESFRDNALAWWRNRRHEWSGWATFKQGFLKFFLPVNFWDDLEDAIRRRQQREDEPFKDYALALETLMRHTQYQPLQKVERIYK